MFAREWSHLQEDRISEPSMSDPEEQEDETTPAVFIAKQRELAQKSPALSQAGLDRLESDRGAGHTPLLRFQLMWLALMILAIISGVLVNSGVIRAVHLPRLRSIASAPQPLSSLAEVKREWTDGQWTVTSLDRQLEGVPYVVSVHDWHRSDAVLQARPLLGRCRELSGDRAPLLCVNRGRVASYAYASAPTSVIETPRIINPNQLLESEESLMLTAGTDVLCQQVIIPPPITNFFQSLAENILNPLLHIFSFLQMTHGTFLQVLKIS
ncbi:MAG: uncharacterized protein KVP18_003578 [Porospora cf. gigantea A]|uniref:uncharacterized protein n=1 Tax=Porospora cf. gigantea A TaxID=2853593 RepID=UPI00355956BF|nr:MAG: hypothetical protein KVP18_003578 [Porospora cf. gigantea A]